MSKTIVVKPVSGSINAIQDNIRKARDKVRASIRGYQQMKFASGSFEKKENEVMDKRIFLIPSILIGFIITYYQYLVMTILLNAAGIMLLVSYGMLGIIQNCVYFFLLFRLDDTFRYYNRGKSTGNLFDNKFGRAILLLIIGIIILPVVEYATIRYLILQRSFVMGFLELWWIYCVAAILSWLYALPSAICSYFANRRFEKKLNQQGLEKSYLVRG